jgi:hypothetical protein
MVKRARPQCSVCGHAKRQLIETEWVAGIARTLIAEKHGLSRQSLFRHMRNHVSAAERAEILTDIPLAELAKRSAEEGISLLDYLAIIRRAVMQALLTASQYGDMNAIAKLSARGTELLRFQAELAGDLSKVAMTFRQSHTTIHNTLTFTQSPLFSRLQRMLVDRLARAHPAAFQAVLQGLEELAAEDTKTAALPPPGASPARSAEPGAIDKLLRSRRCPLTRSTRSTRRCGRTGGCWRGPNSCRHRATGRSGCSWAAVVSASPARLRVGQRHCSSRGGPDRHGSGHSRRCP